MGDNGRTAIAKRYDKNGFVMNQTERQVAIVDHVDAVGACSYQQLATRLGVSEMTIRRDVDKLVRRGEVIKALGGAQTAHASKHLYESAVQQRLNLLWRQKEQIASQAIGRIEPQQTIFIDGGTTCLALARQVMRQLRGLTVVTHSALACLELGRTMDNTIISLGGQFDPSSACFVGPRAEEVAHRLFVDIAFLSTKGVLPDEGIFESAMATFRIKQIVAESAARVILLVDHSKFGQRALCKALDIAQIDELITDAGTKASDIEVLQQRGLEVRVAPEDRVPSVSTEGRSM
jgi:DeoR/GlpR family transcriptional regulator of sugar metabolism